MDAFSEEKVEKQIQDIFLTDESQVNENFEQSDLVHGKKLLSPILGYRYELPDLPTSYVPSVALDTTLSHIPIYTHLKIHDLKPVKRPKAPSILSTLHLQFSEDACKSSREMSTARASEEDTTSVSHSFRNDTKLNAHEKW